MRLCRVNSTKNVFFNQRHPTTESCTTELVSNVSAQFSPAHKLLSFLSNFLLEQLKMDGLWKVAVLDVSQQSTYQNVTGREFQAQNNRKKLQQTRNRKALHPL